MPDCKPCADNGIIVPAMRVVNGVPKCDACFRNEQAPPPTKEQPEMKPKIDWREAQKRRDAGESVADIAESLGCSDVNVYTHTHKAKGGATPRATRTVTRKKEKSVETGKGDLLTSLRAEREELDRVIAFLEKRA